MTYYTVRKQFNIYILDLNRLSIDLKQLQIEAAPNTNIFVVLDDISEDSLYTDVHNEFFKIVDDTFKQHNIDYCLVTNTRNKNFKFPFNNVVFSSFGLIAYYHQYYGKNKNSINEYWNFNSKRGLYVPGKIERFSRTVLMYELYKNNLLQHIDWSFNVSEKSKQLIRKEFLNFLSDQEFDDFIKYCNKSLDINPYDSDRSFFIQNEDFILKSPWPYDPLIYTNTSFSIVSETWFMYGSVPTLTEKIYRPMLNKHPFIAMAAPRTLQILKDLGFRTFENYLPINYDLIEDERKRLDAVIICINHFIQTYQNYIEPIKLDLEHNLTRFKEMVESEVTQIKSILPKDIDSRTPFDWTHIRNA